MHDVPAQGYPPTWNSPYGVTFNQIDYVAVNRRWRSYVLDVCAIRGGDIGSEHNLVLCKLQVEEEKEASNTKIVQLVETSRSKTGIFKVVKKGEKLWKNGRRIKILFKIIAKERFFFQDKQGFFIRWMQSSNFFLDKRGLFKMNAKNIFFKFKMNAKQWNVFQVISKTGIVLVQNQDLLIFLIER